MSVMSTDNRSQSHPAAKAKSVKLVTGDDMYVLLFVCLHYSNNLLFTELISPVEMTQ
jgi:hypothetical protein